MCVCVCPSVCVVFIDCSATCLQNILISSHCLPFSCLYDHSLRYSSPLCLMLAFSTSSTTSAFESYLANRMIILRLSELSSLSLNKSTTCTNPLTMTAICCLKQWQLLVHVINTFLHSTIVYLRLHLKVLIAFLLISLLPLCCFSTNSFQHVQSFTWC